jgi:hypothetical protein
MSSFPTERRALQPRTPLLRVDSRVLAIVVVACVGLFAVSFVIGRAMSPGRGGGAAQLPEFAATQASAEVPVNLGVAPALRVGTPIAAVVHARRSSAKATAVTNTAPVTPPAGALPVLTQQTAPPAAPAPVSVQPPATVTPSPTKTPVKSPSSTPAGGGTGGGSSAPKGGGGISFDSSG